jgi:cytochrome c oxidase subunit 1
MVKVKTGEQVLKELEDNADAHIHMPSPSYWPIVLAAGLPVIAFGVIYSIPIAIFGGVIVLFGCYGWAIEPSTAPDDDFDPPVTTKDVVHVG